MKDLVDPSPVTVPGNEGQELSGAFKPAALVKRRVYVAPFVVPKETVVVPLERPINRFGAGGGGGGTEFVEARVKLIVPSGFNRKYPTK